MRRERVEPAPRATRRSAPERAEDPDALSALQAAAGNHAVVQLLSGAGPGPAAAARGGSLSGRAGPVVQRSESLEKLGLDKSLDKQGAPDSLELPAALRAGLAAAWQQSFPEGRSCEQGGILVKTAAGAYVWRAGPTGSSGTFSVNYRDLRPGEVLIASGHTHPYDAGEGGHTDIAFSAADLANLVWQSERVKLVQSGDTRFAIAKTAAFDALVAAADTGEKKRELIAEMESTWATAVKASTKKSFQAKVRDAVGAVADKYHLVYYEGQGESLAKGTPWVHVESVAPSLPTDPAALPAVPGPEAQEGDGVAEPRPSWLARLVARIRGWLGW